MSDLPGDGGILSKVKNMVSGKEKTYLADELQDYEGEDEDVPEPRPNRDPLAIIKSEVERLKAETYALKEAKNITNERFMRVAEEIGSVREGMAEEQKELRNLLVRTTKAVDLVESVQPDQLLKEVRRMDARFEEHSTRIDTNKSLLDQMVKDLKDIRSQISLFKGVEQTIKLNKEVNKKLQDVEKIRQTAERHSDKVENIFIELNKKFSRFEQYEKTAKQVEEGIKDLFSEMDKMRLRVQGFATKDDIDQASKENEEEIEIALSSINELKMEVAKIDMQLRDFEGGSREEVIARISEIESRLEEASGRELNQMVRDLAQKIHAIEEFYSEEKARNGMLLASIEQLRRDVYNLENKVSHTAVEKNDSYEIGEYAFILAEYIETHLKSIFSEDEIVNYLLRYNIPMKDIEIALKYLS